MVTTSKLFTKVTGRVRESYRVIVMLVRAILSKQKISYGLNEASKLYIRTVLSHASDRLLSPISSSVYSTTSDIDGQEPVYILCNLMEQVIILEKGLHFKVIPSSLNSPSISPIYRNPECPIQYTRSSHLQLESSSNTKQISTPEPHTPERTGLTATTGSPRRSVHHGSRGLNDTRVPTAR